MTSIEVPPCRLGLNPHSWTTEDEVTARCLACGETASVDDLYVSGVDAEKIRRWIAEHGVPDAS